MTEKDRLLPSEKANKNGGKGDILKTSLYDATAPPPIIKPRQIFLHQSINLLCWLSFLQAIAIVGCIHYWQGFLLPIVWCLILSITTLYFLLSVHGLFLWIRGDLSQPRYHRHPGYPEVRYATSADGTNRSIEYFIWGSYKHDATVTVVCHGSSMTGLYFHKTLYPDAIMKLLNVKVISPSYPGHGGSDAQPFRRISDWPYSDLMPILELEGLNRNQPFMVQGASSYGTAHAMATAAAMPNRVMAMGLQVPYLPAPICREFGFHTDEDMIFSEAQCQQPSSRLPILSLFSLFQKWIVLGISILPEGAKVKRDLPDVMEAMKADTDRSFLRGVGGQSLELTNALTTQYWQDPRTITTPVVAVWYALDDGAVPPQHGKWLADLFQSKKGVRINIRAEDKGWGHFTYFGPEEQDTGMQTKVLLDLLKEKTIQSLV